jgi:uncharacterized Zn finger protein (UPF0148 family)
MTPCPRCTTPLDPEYVQYLRHIGERVICPPCEEEETNDEA